MQHGDLGKGDTKIPLPYVEVFPPRMEHLHGNVVQAMIALQSMSVKRWRTEAYVGEEVENGSVG